MPPVTMRIVAPLASKPTLAATLSCLASAKQVIHWLIPEPILSIIADVICPIVDCMKFWSFM
jgi:hypothetical protein